MSAVLRIGTRGSRLALAQAEWVRQRLTEARPALRAELVVIKTSGDRIHDRPLREMGGKGLFVKELEGALEAGTIDCAVHSLKDLPGILAPGLIVAAVPERAAAHDVALTRGAEGLSGLPTGARVGTSSPRRAALVRALHPRLAVVDLRGNVDTRLAKLAAGEVDALVLAAAGLQRLGLRPPHAEPCDVRTFVPAVGQGALAIESRPGETAKRVAAIEHGPTRQAVDAERAFLIAVEGSCVTPLAAHATIAGGRLALRALIARPDGTRIVRGERAGAADDAADIGRALADALLREGGAAVLGELGWRG